MKHFDDLTKIDVPFRELDKDTKNRLRKCSSIDILSMGDIWEPLGNGTDIGNQSTLTYRKSEDRKG
jgi:hypothetical protein